MRYIKIIGGLGNQLFQYSFAYYIYKKNKRTKLDISEYNYYTLHKLLLNRFRINLKYANYKETKKFYLFKNILISYHLRAISLKLYRFLHKFLNSSSVIYEKNFDKRKILSETLFDGYWQNLKYLEENKKILKRQFQLKKISNFHRKFLKLLSNKKNSVAIHIRIYRNYRNEKNFHGNVSPEYILKAIRKIEAQIENPHYFIFSNSKDWFIKNINMNEKNFQIIHGYKDYEDLISISKCKHQIISNSTFGWWGAWLNENPNKIVIAPKKWFKKRKNIKNFISKNWLQI